VYLFGQAMRAGLLDESIFLCLQNAMGDRVYTQQCRIMRYFAIVLAPCGYLLYTLPHTKEIGGPDEGVCSHAV